MRSVVVALAAALRLSGQAGSISLLWDGVTRTNLPSLKVGRYEGEEDVVSAGLTQELWKDAKVEIAAYQFRVHFFFEAAADAAGPVEVSGVQVASDAAVSATASLTGALPGKGDIWVDLTCAEAAVAKVTVTLELAAPFLSPSWVFTKMCRADGHAGLQVGKEPGGADVVAAGTPVWSSTHVVPYADFVLPLFASLSQGPALLLDPVRLKVTPVTSAEVALALRGSETARRAHGRWGSAPPLETRAVAALLDQVGGLQHARAANATLAKGLRALAQAPSGVVSISGALADGELLEEGPAPELLVTFACPHIGSFAVELTLEPFPAYQPYHPVPLSFVKVCGGAERPGFHVGVEPGGQDLVKDGVLAGEHASLDNVADSSTIHVTYVPLSPADPDQAPELTISCAGMEGEQIVDLRVEPSPDHVLLQYECKAVGLAFCELTFAFTMWKAPAPVKWTKECGGVRKDITITSALEEFPTAWAAGALDPGWSVRMSWDEDSVAMQAAAEVPVKATLRVQSELPVSVEPAVLELGPKPQDFKLLASCDGAKEGAYTSELIATMPGYKEIRVPFEKACKKPEFVTFSEAPGGMMGMVVLIALVVAVPVSICAFCIVRNLRGGS